LRLHEHGNAKAGQLERVGHALLVAEVRQSDEHASDPIAVGLEEPGRPDDKTVLWRGQVTSTPADHRIPRPRSFTMSATAAGLVYPDRERPDSASRGLICVRWQPPPLRRPDHHNEIEINLLESGSLKYLVGGRMTMVEAGRLTVFWAAIPHRVIEFAADTSCFVATIPLPWFLQWRLPDQLVQPLMHGMIVSEPENGLGDTDARLFSHWESELAAYDSALEKAVLLEMQARLVRLALQLPAQASTMNDPKRRAYLTDVGLSKSERMACFIARNYTERLTVDQIASFVGLHPSYAMNLFHRVFGSTLVDYLTHHRVSHAQRLLATTDRKITRIAFESGFCSISRFNEAFRRACICSPRAYRNAYCSGSAVAGGPLPAVGFRMASWNSGHGRHVGPSTIER
jgi:AraC-like DNA-binding protein